MPTLIENDPKHHAAKVAQLLEDVARHCRSDIGKLKEPKIRAVLETVAEGALGLRNALKHYETGAEKAMKK
jgi:hypothetical protein